MIGRDDASPMCGAHGQPSAAGLSIERYINLHVECEFVTRLTIYELLLGCRCSLVRVCFPLDVSGFF